MAMLWVPRHPKAHPEMLGFIPEFLNDADPRSAREQFNGNYVGGWKPPFDGGFTMKPNGLAYPGDPDMPLLFETKLRDETIRFYDCAWVAIVQKDGSYELCRMD